MTFAYPWLLLLIVPVILLCHAIHRLGDWRANRRLRRLLGGAHERYRAQAGRPPLWIPHRYFVALCFVFVIIALARPYFVRDDLPDGEGTRIGTDFLIAIDASKSMLARDTQTTESWRRAYRSRYGESSGLGTFVGEGAAERARMRRLRNMARYDEPDSFSRLQSAKQAIHVLLDAARGDRIGLLAFTEEASLRAPLTFDVEALALVLESIHPGTVPPGGTSLESVILRAHAVFEDKGIDRPVLVILSDGEDHEGNAFAAASEFRRELGGVIHTVGIGTTTGSKIRVQAEGRHPYARDELGREITTRLDPLGLGRVARAAGGEYADLGLDGQGLIDLYRRHIKPYGDASPEEFPPGAIELFQIPLLFGVLCLLAEMLVRGKARELQTRAILQS